MRPGANRRDQGGSFWGFRSVSQRFNEARRESPGSVQTTETKYVDGYDASMRPGANRRDQWLATLIARGTGRSFNEARRESPGSGCQRRTD